MANQFCEFDPINEYETCILKKKKQKKRKKKG